jgi:hypothetical protein
MDFCIYCVVAKNAQFHTAFSAKTLFVTLRSAYPLITCNSASSLNALYTTESAQFYSVFLPTAIGLTQRCHQKRVLLKILNTI